ncbi:MAG: hypothetical protein ACR2FY_01910 [Pirellulaceae bacterium]
MLTTRSAGLLLTVFCGLAVAGEPPAAKPEQGRLLGRFTAADTGQPVAGARVKLLIQGVPGKKAPVEAVSDADGQYAVDLPLGHCRVWGVSTPAGYYTQDPKTYGAILTTAAAPRVIRDFVLQTGSPWRVELHGAKAPLDKPAYFSAILNPEREMFANGEAINTTGDADGKSVLTIPTTGGRYRFTCGLMASPDNYDIAPANLEIDKDFDPREIKGAPEPIAERKAVRLHDAAGRSAVVEGAEVHIEAGEAVLRFHAEPIPIASALVLRGSAVDEAGKPVAGARFTAAFASGRGGAMSQLEGMTDAQGKLEIPDVLLPQSRFGPDSRINMMVVKAGFDGAQTKELNLLEVKKAGSGDFGTVVLKPGRTLRGKVVDEDGKGVHGALVTNLTNYFLYSHLACRTDAQGQFTMPDLSYGSQKIWAVFGERYRQVEFNFDATSGECVITLPPSPKGIPVPKAGTSATAKPRAVQPAQPARDDGAWDLAPPKKEPKYQKEPRYALLVFGDKREQRVWMVLDGTTLYVDRNANGDLTEPEERLEPNKPKDGSNKIGNPGRYTGMDHFEFAVQAGIGGTSKFKLDRWVRDEAFIPKTDFDKELHAKWQKYRWENSTLWRKDGLGQGQTPLLFMPKPADAQVCALDGPLTFVLKSPEDQVLQRGEAGGDVAFKIAVMGRPPSGSEQQFLNPLATKEVPEGAHLAVEIEYPAKEAKDPPLRLKYFLKLRC